MAAARGDFDEAVRLAREALGRLPKEVRAYCVLAKAAFAAKDFTQTRLIASQGFKLDENSACLHFVLGNLHMAEKETAVALSFYEKAAQLDPQLVEARFRIAEVSMSYKDFGRAAANFRAITESQPKNAGAFVNLGVAAKGGNNLEAAEQAYLKAIEVAGSEPVPAAHFNLGVLYLKNMNRLDDAQTHLKRYLQVGNAGSDDLAFGMLEEITQRRAMEVEMKRQEEESARQSEIDAKAAEEEARRAKAEEEAKKKQPGAAPEGKSGEPSDPTPPVTP
jgi:tetratricopeptide (TPR) repeat protein